MRPAAEIDEFPGGVERNHGIFGFFFHQLALEDLLGLLVKLDRFGLGQQLPLIGKILRRKLVHLVLDFGQILGRERFLPQKLVKKSGLDGRADAQFHVGIKLHHRSGKQMRRGVPKDKKCIGIFFGEDLQLNVVIERPPQIDQFAGPIVWFGHPRHQRSVGQARRNFPRDIRGGSPLRNFLNLAVRQRNLNRIHALISPESGSIEAYRRDPTRSRQRAA